MIADKYERFRPDLNFIHRYWDAQNAASGSDYDPNSNVSSKNNATLAAETGKRARIYTKRLAMWEKLRDLYGEDAADRYIDDLESHRLYCHDETSVVGMPYCASITLYPFLMHGLAGLGGTSDAPKHLDSFAGSFVNLVFAASAQVAGAIATPEFLPYLNYFLVKEYGESYWQESDKVVDLSRRHRTIGEIIDDTFAQVVYSINQPSAARGNQSVFWNVAYFDEPYFKSLFDNFVFPDGTIMTDLWESYWWLQCRFMKWFNKERLRKPLTFPVESFSLLNDGKDCVDQRAKEFVCQMYEEGHSFFTYTSDSVDSLASCCFSGDTKIIAKSSNGVHFMRIEDLHDMKWNEKKNLTVLHNGSWVRAKVIKLPARQMYRITTSNNKTFEVTDNHLWPTLDGVIRTDQLDLESYLMFNTLSLDAVPEKDRKLTWAQGYIVGMYLGDGTIERKKDKYVTVNYSLSEKKCDESLAIMNKALIDCGIEKQFTVSPLRYNCSHVSVYCSQLADFIAEYVVEGKSFEKRIKPDVLLQNLEFRKGILDGLEATDGGNSNRIYTTSEGLAEDIEWLCTSVGLNTIIDVSDRTDEPVIIRGKEYERNYPLRCIRYYTPKNRRSMDGVFKIRNNSIYFKVTSIEKIDSASDNVYCFERYDADDPFFTLPSGAITHNCRLRNGISENTFSYSLGAGGIATGSKCVMTININRLVQDAVRGHEQDAFKDKLELIRERVDMMTNNVHKYLSAFNALVKEAQAHHMIPLYDAGFVTPEKQYLTVGVNGFVEGAEYLGIEINDNQKYAMYVDAILGTISELNKADKTPEKMYNTEFVPSL